MAQKKTVRKKAKAVVGSRAITGSDARKGGGLRKTLGVVCAVILVAAVGHYFTRDSHAAVNCTVSSTLVNSCHPWFGAAVGGDPGAASDKVSQFTYLESKTGRQLDLYHTYHAPGSIPLSSDEIHFAERANTYAYVNWKPASTWAAAGGGNASVNASIKKAADNIKAIAPHKIFLTVWHEPENDISGFDNTAEQTACKNSVHFSGLKGSAGTPAQYRAMWQNVRNIFNAGGVTNVVWAMNYMGYQNWDCLIQPMWPGNGLADWVTMDAYGDGGNPTWTASVGRIYNVLQADSNATDNFNSKPWGSAEFNVNCSDTSANYAGYYASAKTALDSNAYPRLKMYMVFDSASGPGGTSGCLVDRNATTLNAFKSFANDPIFTKQASVSVPPPTGGTPPPPSGGGSGGSPGPGGTTPPPPPVASGSGSSSGASHSGSPPVDPYIKPNVDGTIKLESGDTLSTSVKVDGQTLSNDGNLNTTYLTNGEHTLTVTKKQADGTTKTETRKIDVNNKLSLWRKVRNAVFSPLKGNPTLMNTSFGISVAAVVVTTAYTLYFFRVPQSLYSRLQSITRHT